MFKVECQANKNPSIHSEKNSIFWSIVNVFNNQKNIIPKHASFKKIPLSFYVKNSSF